MSKSLVKQGLQLFDGTEEAEKSTQKAQKKRGVQRNNQNFKKFLSSEKKYSGKSIDQIRKQISKEKDKTEENLRKLNALSKNLVTVEKTSSIFKRANRSREEAEIVKPVEGTAFTEEDFAMFEREYVVD